MRHVFFLLLLATCSVFGATKKSSASAYGKPNVLFIAIDDLNELLAANSSDDVQVIVQIDRARGFFELGIGGVANWETMKRFRVRNDSLEEIEDLGEQDTGDPEVLSDFIRWGFATYPSQRRLLVLWDHGNAWQGYGGDDSAEHIPRPRRRQKRPRLRSAATR